MAVRIRVYPQNGLGMNGFGNGFGMNRMGAVSASTFYNSKLQTQKQVSSLQLGYERALWNERLEKVRLEERLKNPYLGASAGIAGAYGGLPLGLAGGGIPFAGAGLPFAGGQFGLPVGAPFGGVPMGMPGGFAGAGQTNVTNQNSSTAASQSVSNVNTHNVSHQLAHPQLGWGGGTPFGYGGGGFLSGLLGALI